MENVVLIIHLILALCLIGVVLLQRSEGGGLGMGSGDGGGGGVMTGRQAATALAKLTWIFAIAFLATSVTLTILAAQKSAGSSVVDQLGGKTQQAPATTPAKDNSLPAPSGDLLPPSQNNQTDAPATPPRAD
ncbi:preprotein translocase subunit SecG [Acidimangrovimonas pyrenivorans]|uniref:Protein-export membrane protein SecG n=1 Tax=Acidimangrovimonas pyrenivorans TaxID=2030798 RepID=A0ABV7ACF8_9RHOB